MSDLLTAFFAVLIMAVVVAVVCCAIVGAQVLAR